jgi:hypothetical protein
MINGIPVGALLLHITGYPPVSESSPDRPGLSEACGCYLIVVRPVNNSSSLGTVACLRWLVRVPDVAELASPDVAIGSGWGQSSLYYLLLRTEIFGTRAKPDASLVVLLGVRCWKVMVFFQAPF